MMLIGAHVLLLNYEEQELPDAPQQSERCAADELRMSVLVAPHAIASNYHSLHSLHSAGA